MRPSLGLAAALLAACIDYTPPRRDAPPRLVAVEAPTPLDALGRAPTLTLRFDAPIDDPPDDAVLLLTGPPSPSLLADLARPPPSASTLARRVASTLRRDDARTLRLAVTQALAPASALTLALAPSLAEAAPVALRVAPITRCGALASLPIAAVGTAPGPIPIRFDRGVVGNDPVAVLRDANGVRFHSSARLDCFDADGFARCAWITPARPLAPGAYTVDLGALRDRAGSPASPTSLPLRVEARPLSPSPAFAPAPPCAPDERAVADLCAQVRDREIVVRVATRAVAVVRARATPGDQGDPREAVSAAGTVHTLRLGGLRFLTRHAITLWAMDLRGDVAVRFVGAFDTPAPQGDVRITEVLPRPRGAATQEFVELANDGAAAVSLGGWSLRASNGRSVFDVGAVIPARGRAVVVGPGFDLRAAPPVAGGATVIALRGAIAGRGLRDDGGDLLLCDPSGAAASRYPGASLMTRAGVSLGRVATDLDDDDPDAWSHDREEDATPGAAERVP